MKKNSLGLLVTVVFFLAYSMINLIQGYFENRNIVQVVMNSQYAKVNDILKVSTTLLEQPLALQEYLKLENEKGNIHFYVLFSDDSKVKFAKGIEPNDLLTFRKSSQKTFMDEDIIILKESFLDKTLVIGYHYPYASKMADLYRVLKTGIIRDLFLVLLSLVTIVSYYFADLNKLIKSFSKHKKDRFKDIATKSAEAEALQSGLNALSTNAYELRDRYSSLKKALYPALRSELDSGLKAPYSFDACLVRVDINGFTVGYNSKYRNEYTALVDDFLQDVVTLIGRHNGLFKEFLGDELIFYFKGPKETACSVAVACLRDISDLVIEHQMKFSNKTQTRLSFKSAISYGTLDFKMQVFQQNISGEPVIESVRLLSQVSDHKRNLLILNQSLHKERVFGLNFIESRVVRLKGYPEDSMISEYELIPISTEQLKTHSFMFPECKSNQCIEILFKELKSAEQLNQFQSVSKFIDQGHFLQLSQMNSQILTSLIESLQQRATADLIWAREITRFISHIGEASLPASEVDRFTEVNLNNFLIQDDRLQANTIELLTKISSDRLSELKDRPFNHNRTLANQLMAESQIEVSSGLVRKLKSMIKDSRPLFQASGIYALRQIYIYYINIDSSVIESNSALKKLINFVVKNNFEDRAHEQQKLLKQVLSERQPQNQ